VKVIPYLDRTTLVNTTLHTVGHTLTEGFMLVVVVLLLFLGSLASALLVAATIPLSLLIAFMMMHLTGIPANLLSLGAIDFGIIINGAIVLMETILARREAEPNAELTIDDIKDAASHVARPMFFATLIIITAYIPLFTFERVEKKALRPDGLYGRVCTGRWGSGCIGPDTGSGLFGLQETEESLPQPGPRLATVQIRGATRTDIGATVVGAGTRCRRGRARGCARFHLGPRVFALP
jgi:hypothetical protein